MAIDWSLDRRGLFSAAAAALFGGILARLGKTQEAGDALARTFVSAARMGGNDGGVLIGGEGLALFDLPARAHAITRLSEREVLLVGRRPGMYAAIIDTSDLNREPKLIAPIAGHRFAGHAALAPDKRLLATTEIDAETGRGVAVIRDPAIGTVLNSIPVGIEPHDLVFADGGARLVVAVGGIARAADVKGPAMNLGCIESAIVELDARSGAILKRHTLGPGLESLSLRHLALNPNGTTVACGMQDQDRSALRPLMGVLHVGGRFELLPLPEQDEASMRFYVGSVGFDASGAYLAATSPKGGMTGLWWASDGRPLSGFKLPDVCGLAASHTAGVFFVTSGFGDVVELAASTEGLAARAHWRAPASFDNHLLSL